VGQRLQAVHSPAEHLLQAVHSPAEYLLQAVRPPEEGLPPVALPQAERRRLVVHSPAGCRLRVVPVPTARHQLLRVTCISWTRLRVWMTRSMAVPTARVRTRR